MNLHLNAHVLNAFRLIPRELFVQEQDKKYAYKDTPLAIPMNQTISAIHMYGIMLSVELCDPQPGINVLEIGTGSGYGAALLAKSVEPDIVISIERHKPLVEYSRNNLKVCGIQNVEIIHGDGTLGIPGKKFDRILVTATGKKIPEPLIKQLKPDGWMIIPLLVNYNEWLCKVYLDENNELQQELLMQVRFVPLIGSEN